MDYVLYHSSCRDGFAAATAAWMDLGEKAQYKPVQYGQEPPLDVMDDIETIYLLDFCYPAHVLTALRTRCKRLVILDHHDTARGEIAVFLNHLRRDEDNNRIMEDERFEHVHFEDEPEHNLDLPDVHIIFDVRYSGAVLAWDYFMGPARLPLMFQYIQDRDLWQWKLPQSKAFSYGIVLLGEDLDKWAAYARNDAWVDEIISKGVAIEKYIDSQVERMVRPGRVTLAEICGVDNIPVVNTSVWQSEVCHRLLEVFEEAPFAATFVQAAEGKRIYSLRSRGEVDVGRLAKQAGGGGHPNASAFSTVPPMDPLQIALYHEAWGVAVEEARYKNLSAISDKHHLMGEICNLATYTYNVGTEAYSFAESRGDGTDQTIIKP